MGVVVVGLEGEGLGGRGWMVGLVRWVRTGGDGSDDSSEDVFEDAF